MARKNKQFGRLLDEGISSAAKRQRMSVATVEDELGASLGYSGHTIQHWRRGNLPTELDQVVAIIRYCVQKGRINREWADSVLQQAQHPTRPLMLDQLFPPIAVSHIGRSAPIYLLPSQSFARRRNRIETCTRV